MVTCPTCKTNLVRRIRRKGFLDHALSVIYFYPYGCQICGRRTRAFKFGVRYKRLELDRRQFERVEALFPASFTFDGGVGEGEVVDVAAGGCRIVTQHTLTTGQIISLQLEIPPATQTIEIASAIVCSALPPFYGIEFIHVDQVHRDQLGEFILGKL